MENNPTPLKALVAIFVFFVAILLALRLSNCKRGEDRTDIKESVESQITHDTIVVREPVTFSDTIVRYVSIPLPIYNHDEKIMHDTIAVVSTDTIRINGDTMQLPITQKVYRDTNYIAYVSGWHPSLDSIAVINQTITNTITRTEYKKRSRWNVGIVAGYGYGIQYHHFEPFAGVAVTYNIFR